MSSTKFSKKDIGYFKISTKLAETSLIKWRLGAVVVSDGKIIGKGVAQDKTHPMQFHCNNVSKRLGEHYECRLHAEIDAITHIPRWIKLDPKAAIYVVRLLNNGNTGMARPCATCMVKLKEMNLQHIYYSTPNGYAYEFLEENKKK